MKVAVEGATLVVMVGGIGLGLGLLVWLFRELFSGPRHR